MASEDANVPTADVDSGIVAGDDVVNLPRVKGDTCGVLATPTRKSPQDRTRDEDGLTPYQQKALLAIMAGKTIMAASRAAGVHHSTLRDWLRDDTSDFVRALERAKAEQAKELAQAKAALAKSIVKFGAVSVQELEKLATGRHAGRRLAAAKAGLAAAAQVVKGSEDEANKQVTPMFVIPPGTAIDFSTAVEPLPADPASVIVDAQLVGAKPASELKGDASIPYTNH